MLKRDSIEETEEFKKIEKLVNEEVENLLEQQGVKKQLGYFHIYQNLKKKILKEKYDIEWKTIEEMNPDIIFD